MARADTIDVPEEYQALFRVVFGTGTILIHPGSVNIAQDELVRRDPHLGSIRPDVITAAMLWARWAFKHAAWLLGCAPYNERHAYWQLAKSKNMHSMHYYRHVNIPAIHDGASDADIQRPDTWTTEPENANHVPYLIKTFTTDGALTLDFEATLDPGTHRHWSGEQSEAPYDLYIRNVYDYGDYDVITVLRTYNPTERTMYQEQITLPPGEGSSVYERRVVFTKQCNEFDIYAPVWKFNIPNITQDTWGWFYEQQTEP